MDIFHYFILLRRRKVIFEVIISLIDLKLSRSHLRFEIGDINPFLYKVRLIPIETDEDFLNFCLSVFTAIFLEALAADFGVYTVKNYFAKFLLVSCFRDMSVFERL